MDTVTPQKSTPALRRRNSAATTVLIPSKLSISTAAANEAGIAAATSSSSSTSRTTSSSSSSSQSFSTIEFEIGSIPNATSYTSLKDLLPSTAVQSPTPSVGGGGGAASSGYEISIRNRLVKQAAWAYLQPMSISSDSVGRSFVHRLWIRFSGDVVNSSLGTFFRRVIGFLARALDGILRAVSR